MSTDDLTVERKAKNTQSAPAPADKSRAEKILYLKNKIKTGKLAIMDKKNIGFSASCAKIANKLMQTK